MDNKPQTVVDFLRRLSPHDFRMMGINELAYIRKVQVDGHQAFAVHAADGTPLAINETRELALGAVLRSDMHLMTVH